MIETFATFQPTIETFSKRIGLVGESNDMPELFSDKSAEVVIEIKDNAFSTYQVFNRFPGASFIPKYVSNRLSTNNLRTPITAISPVSEIKTFATHRHINTAPLQKGSLYFSRPKIKDQYQVSCHEGKVCGIRKIIDGKAVHLDLNRLPELSNLQQIAESLHNSLKSDLLRFRVGTTAKGPVLLAMENFKLQKPELAHIYFTVYENFIGHLPEWFKHHVETNSLIPYLTEYINRDEFSKKCPYLL